MSRWLEDVTGDVRFAVRQLRSATAFTLVAAVTLAFGMAACAPQETTLTAAAAQPAAAQAPAGGGLAGNAEQQAKHAALEKATPKLTVTE